MALPSRWITSVIIVLMSTFSYSTGGKWPFNKSSKETRPRTGQFKRQEGQTVSRQIRCHDAYYMLSYLRLTNPQYYGYPVQPLTDGHFTKDLLSLNDVFGNAKAVTLLTDFGVFGGRDRLIGYLNVKINEINSGNRSFGRYVLSLVDFDEHVQLAFLTTMLRIYYVFLEKLKTVDKDRREEHIKLFLRPYNNWCDFLNLPKKNNGFYVTFLHQSWDCAQYSEIMLARVQKWVIGRLLEIVNESNVPLDNHTVESLGMIDIDESLILTTMSEYQIPLDSTFKASEHLLKEDARPTVLCAEALIAFMKSIFTGVDFRAIKSLVKLKNSTNFERFREYEQLYDAT